MDIMTIFLDLKHDTDAPNSISGCEAKRAKKGSSLSIKSSDHASETAAPSRRYSRTGGIEAFCGNPIKFTSCTQHCLAHSTTSSEFIAASTNSRSMVGNVNMINEIFFFLSNPFLLSLINKYALQEGKINEIKKS